MNNSQTQAQVMTHPLADSFNAKSVAVVGASRDPGKVGFQLLRTLLREGYRGRIFAVNPKESEILGIGCHASIQDIPAPLDLLVISLPAPQVLAVMELAAQRRDIKGAVVISAGFAETAIPEWVEAERTLVKLAKSAGIRVFGPNCNGIINCESRLSTSFAPGLVFTPGRIGYISQSGATGGAIMMMAASEPKPLGFSKFAHIGNMCDVSNLELLELFGADPSIDVITIYMEGVQDGRKFLEIASRVTRVKPVVLFKVGRSATGAVATLSHTGALAGSDNVYDAAFKQSGIVRVKTLEELVDTTKAISMLSRPAGNRVCVLTGTGGLGITCVDQIAQDGVLQLAHLSAHTQERLTRALPFMAVVAKPDGYVDMTAAALKTEYGEALTAILEDSGVDEVVLISLPPTFFPTMEVTEEIVSVSKKFNKPVLLCYMKGEPMVEARSYLENNGIPTFDTPDRAATALAGLVRACAATPAEGPQITFIPTARGASHPLIQQALRDRRNLLEPEAFQLLRENGIKTPAFHFAKNRQEAMAAAAAIGGPAVLKVVSAQVIHKSDVGGVKVNVAGDEAVGRAYDDIVKNINERVPGVRIDGVLVAPCAPEGPELVLGTVKDPQFGPVVMFGLGGIFVEVFKDVSFRVAPFERETALAMIRETKAAAILGGIRGEKPRDIESLAQLLVSVSHLAARCDEISAIDLNPVRVYEKGLAILDCRILVAESKA
jgi:acetyltransferase